MSARDRRPASTVSQRLAPIHTYTNAAEGGDHRHDRHTGCEESAVILVLSEQAHRAPPAPEAVAEAAHGHDRRARRDGRSCPEGSGRRPPPRSSRRRTRSPIRARSSRAAEASPGWRMKNSSSANSLAVSSMSRRPAARSGGGVELEVAHRSAAGRSGRAAADERADAREQLANANGLVR